MAEIDIKVPSYYLVGDQIVSVERPPGRGLAVRGWDFEEREMSFGAATFDDILGHLPPPGDPVQGSSQFASGGDTFEISKAEFDKRLRELQREVVPGPPEPLTRRRGGPAPVAAGSAVEEVNVTQLERSLRADCCDGDSEVPEEMAKVIEAVREFSD